MSWRYTRYIQFPISLHGLYSENFTFTGQTNCFRQTQQYYTRVGPKFSVKHNNSIRGWVQKFPSNTITVYEGGPKIFRQTQQYTRVGPKFSVKHNSIRGWVQNFPPNTTTVYEGGSKIFRQTQQYMRVGPKFSAKHNNSIRGGSKTFRQTQQYTRVGPKFSVKHKSIRGWVQNFSVKHKSIRGWVQNFPSNTTTVYDGGSKIFQPDQLFKVTQTKQLCCFSI